ncbi:MAG: DUF177 domain-containing protein [Beijerinckiaceae bacterium]|nr:MAG: DUF177 domain-containing protein [Beijerinckiaceae bacterium]
MTAEPLPDPRAPAIFSYFVDVEEIPEGGVDVSIAADAATLQALAAADDLPGISRLEADFHIAPRSLRRFNVTGEMRARVTQICGVSLEPFESDIVEQIDVDFAVPQDVRDSKAAHAAGYHGNPKSAGVVVGEDPDPPDTIVDGRIDLGALASEFLALGLDPYPRKPGIVFEPPDNAGADESDSPFRALRKLKDPS